MADQTELIQRAQICTRFLSNHREHRNDVREQSMAVNTDLLTAHQFAFSAVVSYQNRIQGRHFEPQNASIEGRMNLIAQFIQGIELTETAISEGLYAIATNLLKQELETLCAIEEYEARRRRDGRTPRAAGRFQGFVDRMNEFNNIAHPSREEIVASLGTFSDGERYGPTTIPQFNGELYQMLYGNQAMFMLMVLVQMRTVFLEVFDEDVDDEEWRMATSALRILLDHEIVQVRE